MKKKLVAMMMAVCTMVSACGVPVTAKTVTVPKSYQTYLVLTSQELTVNGNEVDMWDHFVSWSGDFDGHWWSQQLGNYYRDVRELDGTGDEYIEPYQIVEDGMVGDVYKATVFTNGTETKEDDTIQIDGFEGFASLSYLDMD